jgi:DNA-binding transcriptional regulator of glucitol operon
MSDQWLWVFVLIAVAMGLQLMLTARQAMAFTRAVHELRRSGTVAIGLHGRRWWGRKVYVALAVDPESIVARAIRLRGITQFAHAKPAPHYTGLTVSYLAGQGVVPGCGDIERAAARQAAQTLSAAGGSPTADGATKGRETSTS